MINVIKTGKIVDGRGYSLVECPICFAHFDTRNDRVKTIKSCSFCQRKKASTTHGDSGTRLYKSWQGMIARGNSTDKSKYFCNIKVCPEWKNYEEFKQWSMNNGYEDDLTIDRIDTFKDYEPDNCRWVSMVTQAQNTRLLRSSNTSGYRGVFWHKKGNKYSSSIQVDNKTFQLGLFATKELGAIAYNNHIIENKLVDFPLNIISIENIMSDYSAMLPNLVAEDTVLISYDQRIF